jgi:hypothetical protein
MRSQLSIRKKLKELEQDANDAMNEHLKRKDGDETYLRVYGKICERIWAIKWVLNLTNEI